MKELIIAINPLTHRRVPNGWVMDHRMSFVTLIRQKYHLIGSSPIIQLSTLEKAIFEELVHETSTSN